MVGKGLGKDLYWSSFSVPVLVDGRLQGWFLLTGWPWNLPAEHWIFTGSLTTFNSTNFQAHLLTTSLTLLEKLNSNCRDLHSAGISIPQGSPFLRDLSTMRTNRMNQRASVSLSFDTQEANLAMELSKTPSRTRYPPTAEMKLTFPQWCLLIPGLCP